MSSNLLPKDSNFLESSLPSPLPPSLLSPLLSPLPLCLSSGGAGSSFGLFVGETGSFSFPSASSSA